MGHPGFNQTVGSHATSGRALGASTAAVMAEAAAARGAVAWGGWSGGGPAARARRRGSPACSASARREQRRGPRVRRGDVRSAILDVLRTRPRRAGEQVNGYQVIQQIAERSGGAWRPSPGSVYPTIQQLQDEGLVETDDERGRKTLRLTAEGATYVAEHADELAAVWRAVRARERDRGGRRASPASSPRSARSWARSGRSSPPARRRSSARRIDVLVDTRRKLYGILADGDERRRGRDEDGDES